MIELEQQITDDYKDINNLAYLT